MNLNTPIYINNTATISSNNFNSPNSRAYDSNRKIVRNTSTGEAYFTCWDLTNKLRVYRVAGNVISDVSPPTILSTVKDIGSIALGTTGILHLIYNTASGIKYQTRATNGTWSGESTVVATAYEVCEILVDNNNYPHVIAKNVNLAYYNGANAYYYTSSTRSTYFRFDGFTWASKFNTYATDHSQVSYSNICVDSNRNTFIYENLNPTTTPYGSTAYAGGINLSRLIKITIEGTITYVNSSMPHASIIRIDKNNVLHSISRNPTTPYGINYIYSVDLGVTWSTPVRLVDLAVGLDYDFSVDNTSNIHIVYTYQNDIYYICRVDGSWSASSILFDGDSAPTKYSAPMIAASGNTNISVAAYEWGSVPDRFAYIGGSSLEVPGTIVASNITSNSVTLTWTTGNNPAGTTYRLRRTKQNGGQVSIVYTGTNLTYTNTGLVEGSVYKYDICTFEDGVEGLYTAQLSVTTTNVAPVVSNVSIAGVAQYPGTLTGSYTYTDISPEGVSLKKWYKSSDGITYEAIAGATSISYSVQVGDIGKYIKFEVTPVQTKEDASMPNVTGITVQSSPVGPIVYSPTAPVASSVTIASQAVDLNFFVGTTIRGTYTYFDINGDAEGSTVFNWYRGTTSGGPWTLITTGTTIAPGNIDYVLDIADDQKYIRLGIIPKNAVTPTQGSEVYSGSTVKISTVPVAPEASDVIVTYNDLWVGSVLTGQYTYFDENGDAEASSQFKWYRGDSISGPWTLIGGATAKTYTMTAADVGKYLKFEVTPISV